MNADSNDITNDKIWQRLVAMSDSLNLIKDVQHDHGKKLDQLSDAISGIADDVATAIESLPDK